jgi:hypothetical protein
VQERGRRMEETGERRREMERVEGRESMGGK